jgi:hypothetical protein
MVFHLTLQIYNIKITKKTIFVFEVGYFVFFFLDDLTLNNMTLILGVDIIMNVSLSINARDI